VTSNLNYNWRSQTYTNIGMESQTHIGGYGTLGGRQGFGADSGRWSFGVYGRNLTNRYYPTGFYVIAPIGVAQFYAPDAKRTVGAFVNASF